MELHVVASSFVVALVLLLPLAIKWQIKLRYALVGVLLFGGITGTILSLGWLRGDMSFPLLLLAELAFVVVLATGAVAFLFYRDPERVPPKQNGIIVSPADGKILYVKKVNNGEVPLAEKGERKFRLQELTKTTLIDNGGYLVGIGMSLINVHVNRAPIGGRVALIKHFEGDFLSLKKPGALLRNERAITVIENSRFKIGVVQIASRLVRRIVLYLKEGEQVALGQRIGMIKFGSQVDLLIPEFKKLKVKVKPGAQVLAGISVIAEYHE